jgi:colicin import membrane protein
MSLSENPGLVVSSTVHVAVLAAAILSFSWSPKFTDAQETIPVEMLTTQDFNQIMRGEKTAKAVQPVQKADKVAELTETKPLPPVAEAKKDVPTPPSPLKRVADPGEADKEEKPQPPKPPERVAALPPPRPQPVTPPLPPVIEKPPPEDAEAIQPKPVPRPKVEPPKEKPKDPPKEEAKKPDPKLKLDEVKKLLEADKTKDPPKPVEKPASKPKSGEESTEPQRKLNLADISKLLSHDAPERKASTGRALQQTASLGSPTASAPKMSPSMEAQMEGWFQDRFHDCWTPPLTQPSGAKYIPEVRTPLNVDGSLAGQPVLVNPPRDPAWRAMADSAVRAILKCNPLPVPEQYKPYYEEWRGRTVRFDAETF